jgi:hypothetical protein
MMAVGAHQIPTWRLLLLNRLRLFRIDYTKVIRFLARPPHLLRQGTSEPKRSARTISPPHAPQKRGNKLIPGAHLATW